MRKAVSSRMHTLDEAFLMTLGGFVRAAGEAGDKAIHGAPDTTPSPCQQPAGPESERRPLQVTVSAVRIVSNAFPFCSPDTDAFLLCFLCVPTAASAACCRP